MRRFHRPSSIVLSFTLLTSACHHENPKSDIKKIFSDQQRSDIDPNQAPYIISVNNGCTGFIIDTDKKIAISAEHCGVTMASKICFLQSRLRSEEWQISPCQYEATVADIIESSAVAELDYVIFRYEFTTNIPHGLQSVNLAKQNWLHKLHQEKRSLTMLGYPADAYQRTRLTSSSCLVRDPTIQSLSSNMTAEARASIDAIIKRWESDKRYFERDDYPAMRAACFFIGSSNLKFRPTFKEDCSVYGGNSGGPIFIANSRTVIGMPASYYPQPSAEGKKRQSGTNECYDKYWDVYFQPSWGPKPPPSAEDELAKIAQGQKWDKLDRQSNDLSDYPTAIPMHLIAESSKFLQSNPQYLVDEAKLD